MLLVAVLGVALAVFAITPEVQRKAEQAYSYFEQGNYAAAFPLMKAAAEGGDEISMFTLATMYYKGLGTSVDMAKARYWWQKCADLGDTDAAAWVRRIDAQQRSTSSSGGGATETFMVKGVTFTMVRVERGTFTMGATSEQGSDINSNEKPAHQVTLTQDYYIGQTEVTQALWQAVMGNNPSYFKGDNRPVDRVSWNDCQTFITKLNQLTGREFRLPTEAEWEFAARGGNQSQGYKYAGSDDLDAVAWYSDNIPSQSSGNAGYGTQTVATKAPNELGLYDISGNVWEWCQDWYSSYSSGAQTDPTGPSSGSDRVLRCGSWSSRAGGCRVSYRVYYDPSLRDYYFGLRLAL